MNNSRYALEMENVTKEYADFKLDSVNMRLEKGMVMGLVGENGAGKTTIIRLILNAVEKTAGSIKMFGMDHVEKEIEVKEKIGYVSDDDFLLVNSNLKKYAKAFATMYKDWDQELFEKYARMWKLPAKKKFSEYSKGILLAVLAGMAVLAAVTRIVSYKGIVNCVRQIKIYKGTAKKKQVREEQYV